jgi:hypothetical protein
MPITRPAAAMESRNMIETSSMALIGNNPTPSSPTRQIRLVHSQKTCLES